MNNKLFTNTPDTAALDAEYKKYIDNAAHDLMKAEHESDVNLEAKAQEEARWGSWVVSASRRSFAFHQACFAVNPLHTMGGVRPTIETAAIAVGKHIMLRYQEITKKVRPAFFKLLWVKTNIVLAVSDITPTVEVDTNFQTDERIVARRAARSYYDSYTKVGIDPPLIKLVGFDNDGTVIEEIPLGIHELDPAEPVLVQVDIRSESH
jgi:hypothetical protein